MAITGEIRHAIYEALKASHGDEVANGLMELLPPVGWAEVATRHDLAALEERMSLRFQLVDERFATFEARIGERLERALKEQTTRGVRWMLLVAPVLGGLGGAVARF